MYKTKRKQNIQIYLGQVQRSEPSSLSRSTLFVDDKPSPPTFEPIKETRRSTDKAGSKTFHAPTNHLQQLQRLFKDNKQQYLIQL